MAAQIALRLISENPFATAQELPIKFLVLINSAVPPNIMPIDGQEIRDIPIEEAPLLQMLFDIFKATPSDYKDTARPAELANGRQVCETLFHEYYELSFLADSQAKVLANETHCMSFFNREWDGQILDIPSLHITGLGDNPEYGENLYRVADPSRAERIGHVFGHDFPRGLDMNKQIARAIRAMAAKAL